MQKITGTIERITYHDKESHFTVALLVTAKKQQVTLAGSLPGIQIGITATVTGDFVRHREHGRQFEVETFALELPKNAASIEKFLASGAIRGIGKGFAAKIVEKFGPSTLDIIEHSPERLLEIEGLKQKKIDTLVSSWKEQRVLQEVIIFLQGYGISMAYAKRILRTYGFEALQKIRANPYQLAKDVNGIGFSHADAIAKNLGFAHDAKERIEAGIDFVLYSLAQDGHVNFPMEPFITHACEMLAVEEPLIRECIQNLLLREEIVVKTILEKELIWAKKLYYSEVGIAQELKRLLTSTSATREVVAEKAIAWAEEIFRIQFADAQKDAICQVLQEKVSIITGGPGTGKSTITKAIVAILKKLTPKIVLAAPTGRAAKRMTEITHHFATTIHRLLKYDFAKGGFQHDRKNPIQADLIIIDESSMIDTFLMYQLLRAIPSSCRVVIIGDCNQLPSIGPGNVLRDLIDSKHVPTSALSVIFRQAKGSDIVTNAHKINAGEFPFIQNKKPNSDFFFAEANETEDAKKLILDLITKRIPDKFGFDMKRDIQLLTPMRKGPLGIDLFNTELQQALTPSASTGYFRVGDKVMQLKNNYQKEVFNGDIGYITAIDEASMVVDFDDRLVEYGETETFELTLAYAVSVHKYQGSECPAIVVPIHTSHFKMLTRNLLYTAVTRGRKLVCLVGSKKALGMAVSNNIIQKRHTALSHLF